MMGNITLLEFLSMGREVPGHRPWPRYQLDAKGWKRLAEQMTASGTELLLDGPGPLAARVAREVPQWKELVRTAGITLE